MRLPLALVGLIALLPVEAVAAACCVSSTTGGIGRLRVWERAAVGVSGSLGHGLGYWDGDSAWHPYGESYGEREARGTAWGIVRLSRRVQVWGTAPLLRTWRSGPSVGSAGGGLGDTVTGLRYDLLEVGEIRELPAVALGASLLVPTGRSADRSEDTLGADTTGRGAVALGLSASLEWTFLPWFVRLDPDVSIPLPARRQDTGAVQRFGPGLGTRAIVGVELVPDVLVLDGSARTRWEAAIHLDGEAVPGSERLVSGLGLGLGWTLHPHWTLTAGVDLDAPLSRLGDNAPARAAASAGVRYGHF